MSQIKLGRMCRYCVNRPCHEQIYAKSPVLEGETDFQVILNI